MTKPTNPDHLVNQLVLPGPKHQVTGQQSIQIVGGLTKFEHFVGLALQGVMSRDSDHRDIPTKVSTAVRAAKDLVKQLNEHAEETASMAQVLQDAPERQDD